jgi:hypothetical protein
MNQNESEFNVNIYLAPYLDDIVNETINSINRELDSGLIIGLLLGRYEHFIIPIELDIVKSLRKIDRTFTHKVCACVIKV